LRSSLNHLGMMVICVRQWINFEVSTFLGYFLDIHMIIKVFSTSADNFNDQV
jgi:hypothetical protein